jgi:hypothetical protein
MERRNISRAWWAVSAVWIDRAGEDSSFLRSLPMEGSSSTTRTL